MTTPFSEADFNRDMPTDRCNVLVTGDLGRGKTFYAKHQLVAWGGTVLNDFVTARDLCELVDRARDDRAEREALRHFEQAAAIVVDDVGANSVTKASAANLVRLIESRYSSGLVTIVTTNLDLDEVQDNLDPRLGSRWNGYYVLQGRAEDRRDAQDGALPEQAKATQWRDKPLCVRFFDRPPAQREQVKNLLGMVSRYGSKPQFDIPWWLCVSGDRYGENRPWNPHDAEMIAHAESIWEAAEQGCEWREPHRGRSGMDLDAEALRRCYNEVKGEG